MNSASPKTTSTEQQPAGAVRRTSLATTALALAAAGSLAAAASMAQAQSAESAVDSAAPTTAQTTAQTPAELSPPLVDAPPVDQVVGQAPAYDPLEGVNRGSFRFSMGLDKVVLRPIAHGYMSVTPTPVRHRVSSVLYNLGEPSTALTDILQGRPKRFGVTASRFLINSTIGVLGLWDVAAKMNLPSHDGDFGQTFGRYGVKPGPYLYVPVIGPSNFRDGVGRVLDIVTDPVGIIGGGYKTTFGATRLVTQTIDSRARADNAFRALDDATDPYVTARSAFGQYREAFIREATGEVQALPDFDDTSSEPAAAPAEPTPATPKQ